MQRDIQGLTLFRRGQRVKFQKTYRKPADRKFEIVNVVDGMGAIATAKAKPPRRKADTAGGVDQLMRDFGGVPGAQNPKIGRAREGKSGRQDARYHL